MTAKRFGRQGGQNRNRHLYRDVNPDVYDRFGQHKRLGIYRCCGRHYTDEMHFAYPVGNVVKTGLSGALDNLRQAKLSASEDELAFLNCAEAGLLAAKRIAERFAETASCHGVETASCHGVETASRHGVETASRHGVETASCHGVETASCHGVETASRHGAETASRHNLKMLIEAADHAPWKPCRTFLEGLNTLWFCRQVLGVIDGIGNSHLGRPDVCFIDLYRADIADGRLTEKEALRLVRLFLQAHRETGRIYPKLHCRICADSPKAYLDEIASDYLAGRSVIGLSCDEGYIPALLQDGLSLTDARNYVNTGCWSAVSEENESVPGGNYFYMIRVLQETVYGPTSAWTDAGAFCRPMDDAADFEELYRILRDNILRLMKWRNAAIGRYGKIAPQVNPLALTSAFLNDCPEKRRDFTQGGCRYNRNTVDPAGFANIVDALCAMKTLCFDRRLLTPRAGLDAVRGNRTGQENLLAQVRHCPHFGDCGNESTAIANRLYRDLYDGTREEINERGGHFSLNYIVYREFLLQAKNIKATPDGRRDGDLYALGIGPSRYHEADAVTDMIMSVGSLNPALANVSALDLQLPRGVIDKDRLSDLLRAVCRVGVKHLQFNIVNPDELRDAQVYSELHGDLIVRVCGFSAKSVSLSPVFQDEVIQRHLYR